jgi:hypothetical protein
MHQTVKFGTVGSVGDLARISREFHRRGLDIRAVGGAEANLRGGGIGVMSFLLEPDDHDLGDSFIDEMLGLDLGNGRTPTEVIVHPGFDLELGDQPGALADATELLGREGPDGPAINIMSALLVDVHNDWAIVSLSFEDAATVERAAQRFRDEGNFTVMEEHGGRKRREKVNKTIEGKVRRGDTDDGEDLDDGPGHSH